jgi:hypothetical protein
VMKAACTTVGARVVELVLCWLSAGQLGVWIPAEARNVSVLQNVQTCFWGLPILLFGGYQGVLLPWGKVAGMGGLSLTRI